jgi:hypothetical protein
MCKPKKKIITLLVPLSVINMALVRMMDLVYAVKIMILS